MNRWGPNAAHMNQTDYCYACHYEITEPEFAIVLFAGERASKNSPPKDFVAVHKITCDKGYCTRSMELTELLAMTGPQQAYPWEPIPPEPGPGPDALFEEDEPALDLINDENPYG